MPDSTEILQQTNFSLLDWVIVIVYPLISLGIGLYVCKFITNMKDFVVAGQGLGVCLGIATITGTELGLITVMYSAEKGFVGGFAAFHIAVASGVVAFVVGATGFIVFRLRDMGVMTIPEFYERRFDRKTRILGGIMMALGGILNMGLFLKVGAMFIVGITGMSAEGWALPAVMSSLIALVLIYTCLGGMISVVIADYVQFVVLSFGLLVASGLALYHFGWSEIVDTVQQTMGDKGFDPTVAEGEFGWEYIAWMGFLGLVNCGLWPTAVARALAMKSAHAVKRQYMFASISWMIRFLIPYFWGICAFVLVMQTDAMQTLFFPAGYPPPDTLPDGVTAMDDLYAMPILLGRVLPAGLIGLVTAGMIAAFMSTHDSYLLCWSSVLTQDVVAPIREIMGKPLGAKARILLTRLFILLIGLYVLYWGLIYQGDDDIWDYMTVTGAIYFSGAFALLVGGLYWKRASSTGAVLALLAGFIAILGLSPAQDLLGWIATKAIVLGGYDPVQVFHLGPGEDQLQVDIPSARVGLISIAVTTVAMFLGSILFPDRKVPRDPAKTSSGNA